MADYVASLLSNPLPPRPAQAGRGFNCTLLEDCIMKKSMYDMFTFNLLDIWMVSAKDSTYYDNDHSSFGFDFFKIQTKSFVGFEKTRFHVTIKLLFITLKY